MAFMAILLESMIVKHAVSLDIHIIIF